MTSLQDQLLKAGLIDQKKAKQASKEKRKQDKVARRSEPSVDESKQAAQEALAAKAERDRELNRQRQEQQEQKALQAQIKQLIERHRQPKGAGKGELEYKFTDGKLIKKLLVSAQVHRQIVQGQLAVARLGENYELVPRVVADKIAQRDANRIVVANTQSATPEQDEDDPYKDYVIPDDLMW